MEEAWYQPFKSILMALLQRGVEGLELPAIDVKVFCELFEAINRHGNRAEILNLWDDEVKKDFSMSALDLLAIELNMKNEISQLKQRWV